MLGEGVFRAVLTSPLAEEAVRWVTASYPNVSVTVGHEHVELRSEGYRSHDLERVWYCALINERLRVSNFAHRDAILEELLR